jgi:hypothetical protein
MRVSIPKVFLACVLVGGAAYGITILRGSRAPNEKHHAIEQLEKENLILHREIAAKENYLNRLQQNPDELELEIKRRLLLVNQGSKTFMLQDGKTNSTQKPESGPVR